MKYSRSLRRESRKRELQRITRDNQQILRRIQDARPTYDHLAWEEKARENETIRNNICEFKPRKMRQGGGGLPSSYMVQDDDDRLVEYHNMYHEEDN